MIYSIRIRFLLAILSVIVAAEIYQGLQHNPRDLSLQPQRITHAERKVISPAAVSFQPRHSDLTLSMLMGQSSSQKPFSLIRINNTQQIVPSQDSLLASFVYVRSKNIAIPILELSQPLFDLQAQGAKDLWPNMPPKAISPVVNEQSFLSQVQSQNVTTIALSVVQSFGLEPKILWPNFQPKVITPVSQIRFQNIEIPILKFTPLFSDAEAQGIKSLWPHAHRYYRIIRPLVIFAQAPSAQVKPQKQAALSSDFIRPFDFLHRDIDQNANALWQYRRSKIISPAVNEQKIRVSPIQFQTAETPALKYTPLFLDNRHGIKSLRPHRHLNFIRREIVVVHAPPPQVQSQNLTTFFSDFIPPFDFFRWDTIQPKKIITAEKKVIPSPVVHLQSPLIHILKFTQSFGLEPDVLWPNAQPKVISPVVIQQVHVLQIQPQHVTIPGLKFMPLFSDLNTQGLKKLWPNRQHRYVRPVFVNRIVYVHKSLPRTPSLNLISFFSKVIHPYELLTQHVVHRSHNLPVIQPKRAVVSHEKIIPPAPVSLQAPLSATPISIQSVALMGDVGHTQLVIRLSQQPFYIVSTDSSHQTITLMIDNVNPDISTIPPLDTQGTAIQNIVFNVAPGNKLLVTLSLLPQMEIQGLRFIDNNLVLDVGVETQIPYIHSQNASSLSSADAVQLMVKRPSAMTPDEAASENYDEAVDLLSQKNMEGAAGLLEMVVAEHPDYIDARVLLARVKLEQNDAVQALVLLQGVASQPNIQDDMTYYDLLAESYRQTGDLKSALKVYRQLLAMDSTNGAWWVGLGMCFEGLHQSAASTEAYQRAQLSGNLSPLLQDFVAGKLGSDK